VTAGNDRLRWGLRRISFAFLLAAVVGAAGCPKPTSAPVAAAGEAGAGAPVPAPGAKPIRIAMIAKSSTNPVFLSARRGAETAAKDLAGRTGVPIEIMWLTPPQEDGQIQAQRIAQAVNEGASAVLISCSDAGKVTGAINDAVTVGTSTTCMISISGSSANGRPNRTSVAQREYFEPSTARRIFIAAPVKG